MHFDCHVGHLTVQRGECEMFFFIIACMHAYCCDCLVSREYPHGQLSTVQMCVTCVWCCPCRLYPWHLSMKDLSANSDLQRLTNLHKCIVCKKHNSSYHFRWRLLCILRRCVLMLPGQLDAGCRSACGPQLRGDSSNCGMRRLHALCYVFRIGALFV